MASTEISALPLSNPPPSLSSSSPSPVPSEPSYRVQRPSVYVTRCIPQAGVELLLKEANVKQWVSDQAVPRGEFLHGVPGVQGILCMPSDTIDAELLDTAGPNLRVIATVSCDMHHIDVAECYSRNIQVLCCPNQPSDNFSELTVALVLLTMKETLTEEEKIASFEPQTPDLITTSKDVTNSWANNRPRLMRRLSEERLAFQWSNGKPSNTNCSTWENIASKSFGVYGKTKIGYGVVKLLKNFGVKRVFMCDNETELENSDFLKNDEGDIETVSFLNLLTNSDVICVCGSSGKPVFNRESFKKMSSNVILVTSQSEEQSIDYVDLYEALRDRQIKAAGLNDCNQEPCPFKTPLLGLKNCIFLPQTQESVFDSRHKISCLIAKNLTDALKVKLKMISE